MQTRSSSREHYCLFDTAIGLCAIAWSEHGITALQLPEASRTATERRLKRKRPAAAAAAAEPPAEIARLIAEIQHYSAGASVDFSAVELDLAAVEPFARKVYDAARAIGWGRTVTYGELAREAGFPGEARGVGEALSHNPVAIIIPCHRIVASGQKLGGFSAYGGATAKERLLALEDVQLGTPFLPGLLPAER
jgi:methylated-DNA-[protein]-cysteine S-methyltransferase